MKQLLAANLGFWKQTLSNFEASNFAPWSKCCVDGTLESHGQ